MKNIDENFINEHAIKAIDEVLGIPFEYADTERDSDNLRQITLGAIRGILDFADHLKEALGK